VQPAWNVVHNGEEFEEKKGGNNVDPESPRMCFNSSMQTEYLSGNQSRSKGMV